MNFGKNDWKREDWPCNLTAILTEGLFFFEINLQTAKATVGVQFFLKF